MAYFLIKRSNVYREIHRGNLKNKSFFEITIRNRRYNPPSVKMKVGDIVFVAETNGGIFARGHVVRTDCVQEFSSIGEVLSFSRKFNDEAYWMGKLRVFNECLQRDSNYRLRFHEYFINQKILTRSIPFNGPLAKYDASLKRGLARIFFSLTDEDIRYIEGNPDLSLNHIGILKPEIPNSLRLKLYTFFNRSSRISHFIDIDHFVPKSVGGPGNIIENLVPIGLNLNRVKGDSIPRAFFILASKNEYLRLLTTSKNELDRMLLCQDEFINTRQIPEAKRIALEINASIREWDISKARDFYLRVSEIHNPFFASELKELGSELE